MLPWAAASAGAPTGRVQRADGDGEWSLHLSSVMHWGPGQVTGQFSSRLACGRGWKWHILPSSLPSIFTPGSSAGNSSHSSVGQNQYLLREMSPQHLGLIYLNSFTHSFNKLSLGSCTLGLGVALTWSQTSKSSLFGGRDTR